MEIILSRNVSVNVFDENYGEKSHHSVIKMRQKLKYILCRLFFLTWPVSFYHIQSCLITLTLVEEILNNFKWWLLMINIMLSSNCTVNPVKPQPFFLFFYRSSQTHFIVFLMNSLNFECNYAQSVSISILRT